MSEPEIARRCTACGVSVRQHAMFCPHCGNPLSQAPPTPATAVTEPLIPATPKPKVHHEGVRGRVERIRHVSSVVIDQAAYDPSLRFLLVAAAMFLLFLVLLILSKVLG
jgi:zinc ribbon protein